VRLTENDFLCGGQHVQTQSNFILIANAGEEVVFLFSLGHHLDGVFVEMKVLRPSAPVRRALYLEVSIGTETELFATIDRGIRPSIVRCVTIETSEK
jgi:hypothetical protein